MARFARRLSLVTDRARRPSQIILHIGRNKAGSTTIQHFCAAELGALSACGVEYVMFGHLAESDPQIRGFRTFEELMADVRGRPGLRRLVSNEFMFAWPDEYTEATASALAGADVEILAYIRPYDDWIVSAYAEETRRGMNMRNIDEYFAWMWPRISAWPHLSKWAECFGWDRVRVRDLSADVLRGGDLVTDFVHALQLPLKPEQPVRSNVAPHWGELELTRQLAARNGDVEWAGASPAEVEPLVAELRPLLSSIPPVQYLSIFQRRRLIAQYNEDVARIGRASGVRLTEVRPADPSERLFAPSLAHLPEAVLRDFFRRVSDPGFGVANPEAAARARQLRAQLCLGG